MCKFPQNMLILHCDCFPVGHRALIDKIGLNIFISLKRKFMVTNIQLYNDTYINRKGFRRKSSDLF